MDNTTPVSRPGFLLAAPHSTAEAMEAFDALPKELRDILNYYPVNVSEKWEVLRNPDWAKAVLEAGVKKLSICSLDNVGM